MITIKRGDTLSFIVKRSNESGDPLTGDANKLSAQLRTSKDELIANFTITETDTLGEYLFLIPATITNTFPIGILGYDIQFADVDLVNTTETMFVKVVRDVTRDGE